jgi:hypothetical protein
VRTLGPAACRPSRPAPHTPLDGVPVAEGVTYICGARDPRDVALSFQHHWANLDRDAFMAARARAVGLSDLKELGPPPGPLPEDPMERFWLWADADAGKFVHPALVARLWADAGLRPGEADVVQVYQNFSGPAVASLIDIGLCPPGPGGGGLHDTAQPDRSGGPAARRHRGRQHRRGLRPWNRPGARGGPAGPRHLDQAGARRGRLAAPRRAGCAAGSARPFSHPTGHANSQFPRPSSRAGSERYRLVALDFDRSVVGIASQPFWLYWTDPEGMRVSRWRGARPAIWPGLLTAVLARWCGKAGGSCSVEAEFALPGAV